MCGGLWHYVQSDDIVGLCVMLVQMARDIQLHHEVLRVHLKGCGGYEVATEGDSFKCVFHTPEDAVMYCILAQLDLLAAPWSPELESGGHEVLRGKPDWADCQQPRLAEIRSLILQRQIASVSGISRKHGVRLKMASAALFSPAEVSGLAFSEEWLASQVPPPLTAACASPCLSRLPSHVMV